MRCGISCLTLCSPLYSVSLHYLQIHQSGNTAEGVCSYVCDYIIVQIAVITEREVSHTVEDVCLREREREGERERAREYTLGN